MRGRAAGQPLSEVFDQRRNALNLLRIALAIAVVFSHSLTLGGFRSEVLWGHGTLGDLAVDAFFAVSGFLITPSAERNSVPRYLWQRGLRIFPAFWACLVVTAAAAGPLTWAAAGKPLTGYWPAALRYVTSDWLLTVKSAGIAGTPRGVPFPGAWDGSLWTLRWEFGCYLMVAGLAITGALRRRKAVLWLWLASWAGPLVLAAAGVPTYTDTPAHDLIRFVPVFLAGSVLWLYRDKIPDSGLLAAGALALAAAGTFLRNPEVLSGPPLAYACVWAAVHLPGKRIGSRHDISYGTYIYGFPAAQALACWHLYRLGYVPFTLATLGVTLLLAFASCITVERPALRLKRMAFPHRTAGRHRAAADARQRPANGEASGFVLAPVPPASPRRRPDVCLADGQQDHRILDGGQGVPGGRHHQ
jgi:peptidoglycan/LPS O-acetylase OafA/YrhL